MIHIDQWWSMIWYHSDIYYDSFSFWIYVKYGVLLLPCGRSGMTNSAKIWFLLESWDGTSNSSPVFLRLDERQTGFEKALVRDCHDQQWGSTSVHKSFSSWGWLRGLRGLRGLRIAFGFKHRNRLSDGGLFITAVCWGCGNSNKCSKFISNHSNLARWTTCLYSTSRWTLVFTLNNWLYPLDPSGYLI